MRIAIKPFVYAAIMMTAGGAVAAPLQAPVIGGLSTLETGDWELRSREPGGKIRHICLADARQLLQLRHPGRNCSRFVVTDTAAQVVVTYDCAAAGSGRTALRIETPRLVQIQSQGIADSAPFDFAMEGRRIGACR
ncbi:DUF3617 domain-containing protein [Sphingobium phenoxybenzoativorans]|nr:hypothetical protein [Sphingobium phenoxybenzoativorans]